MAATERTMWVTNANTGALTGIDLVTGQQDQEIDTGHATLAVAAGGDELMVAVGPTVDEAIADLEGSVLTVSTDGAPVVGSAPDPALNGYWEVRQALYITCVGLLAYPDKPAPEGWALEPEAAAAMPTISPDGRTYTFTDQAGVHVLAPIERARHGRDLPCDARAHPVTGLRRRGTGAAALRRHRRRRGVPRGNGRSRAAAWLPTETA